MRQRYFAVAILGLAAVLNTADQAVLVVTLPAIQVDLRLSDLEVGLVSSAFVAVYALAVVISGHLADRRSRRLIIATGVALWSLATLLTGAARSLPQLLLARAGLGIGESTVMPAGVSLLADFCGRRSRGRAVAMLGAGLQVGAGLGAAVGGVVALRFGWRAAFYLAAAPGLLLALVALALHEPVRGGAEPAAPAGAPNPRPIRALRSRTFVAGTLANTLLWFAISGVAGFMGLYASRRFGVDSAHLGALLAPPLLVSGLAGNAAGGWLLDRWGRRSGRPHVEVAALGSALAAAGMVAIFTAPSEAAFEAAFILAASAAQMAVPALLALNQHVVVPSLRGTATAVQQLSTNLVGRAGGLLVIGLVADRLHDLGRAFLFVAPVALALATLSVLSAWSSEEADARAMEREWAGPDLPEALRASA